MGVISAHIYVKRRCVKVLILFSNKVLGWTELRVKIYFRKYQMHGKMKYFYTVCCWKYVYYNNRAENVYLSATAVQNIT